VKGGVKKSTVRTFLVVLVSFLDGGDGDGIVVIVVFVVTLQVRSAHSSLVCSFPHPPLLAFATYRCTQPLVFFL